MEIDIIGTVNYSVYEGDSLVESGTSKNHIVDSGKELIFKRVFLNVASSDYPGRPAYIALGKNNSPTQDEQTGLYEWVQLTSPIDYSLSAPTLFKDGDWTTSLTGYTTSNELYCEQTLNISNGCEVYVTKSNTNASDSSTAATGPRGLDYSSSGVYYVYLTSTTNSKKFRLATTKNSAYAAGGTGPDVTTNNQGFLDTQTFTVGGSTTTDTSISIRSTTWPYVFVLSSTGSTTYNAHTQPFDVSPSIQYCALFTNSTQADIQISEAGLFDNYYDGTSKSATLISRTTFNTINIRPGQRAVIKWQIDFSDVSV